MDLYEERLRRILSLSGDEEDWAHDLARLERGDTTLTRRSAGEAAIKAIQRLLIFLGYSTASSGAFLIDGDFGRGTNRGVAQFQFEHGLNPAVGRGALCYPCRFQTARRLITAVPDVKLDLATLEKMVAAAYAAIAADRIPFGRFDEALFHLNSLDRGQHLDCRGILARYGAAARQAAATLQAERGVVIAPAWILAIIRQETAGIARPRFEQHKLSNANARHPDTPMAELRVQSMSFGLGQIMGFNHHSVGAPSAEAMLYSPMEEQVLYVARFIARKSAVVAKKNPESSDFRIMARFYNGPAYAKHFYHERLARWFREFRRLERDE
jgi:peptidoglycan hydrolase-like protein with peptidoglycan-binding domain